MTNKKHTTDLEQSTWLRYLSGKLSDDERYDLELRLANDPAAKIAIEAMAQNEISPEELETDLSSIRQRWHSRPTAKNRKLSVWVNRVAAVFLIGFGIWAVTIYYQNQESAVLYANFFEADNYLAVRGENTSNSEFSLALKAYNDQNYESSFTQFQHLNELTPEDNQLRLYAAMSAMQLGKHFEAKDLLNNVIDQTTETTEEASAYWYLALVYLQEDNNTECQKHLQWLLDNAPDSQWSSHAMKLMKKLK